MKILFFTNTINFRGTTTAVLDYARYNQLILGNESVIGYYSRFQYQEDIGTEEAVLQKVETEFEVRKMDLQDLDKDTHDIDLAYFIRAGLPEPIPVNCKTAIHAVFQCKGTYGDRYAYISEWLSRVLTNGSVPYVPHIVKLPPPVVNYRKQLGIPAHKKIVGRIGAYTTFDIEFVQKQVSKIAQKNRDIVFLFVNTKPFFNSENIIYVNAFSDLQVKASFINTCDMMIHARSGGESFGLAICESLLLNKATLCYEGGTDRHHVDLLSGTDLLYSEANFLDKFFANLNASRTYSHLVSRFSPEKVMADFRRVFIE